MSPSLSIGSDFALFLFFLSFFYSVILGIMFSSPCSLFELELLTFIDIDYPSLFSLFSPEEGVWR